MDRREPIYSTGETRAEAKYLRLLRAIAYDVGLHDDASTLFGLSDKIARRLLRVVPPAYSVRKD